LKFKVWLVDHHHVFYIRLVRRLLEMVLDEKYGIEIVHAVV